jgi:hypothetical protein
MVTTARNYPGESASTSRNFAIWVSRFPLIAATAIFTAISTRFLLDPVHSAAARGIVFSSNAGITVARVGFGAFPLAFAIILLTCLVSRRRILLGIYMVLTIDAVALAVRTIGMVIDNSVKENIPVLAPEIALLIVSVIALNVELRRRKKETEPVPAALDKIRGDFRNA